MTTAMEIHGVRDDAPIFGLFICQCRRRFDDRDSLYQHIHESERNMAEYDFYISATDLLKIAGEFALEDPQPLEYDGGFVGLLHTSEIRAELLTFELATYLYNGDIGEKRRTGSVFYDLRQIIADLVPRTSFHVDHRREVTYWKNVGLAPEE